MLKKFVVKTPSVAFFLEGDKQTEVLSRPLAAILERLSAETKLAVNFEITYNPHGGEIDSHLDRRINIYVFATPLMETPLSNLNIVKMRGEEIKLKDGQSEWYDYEPKIKGLTMTYLKDIRDENKKVIGLVENNNIFVPFDLFHGIESYAAQGKETMKVLEYIIENAAKHIMVDKDEIERRIEEQPMLEYVKGVIENANKINDKKKKELESVSKSLHTIQRNMVVEQRRFTEIHHLLSCAMSGKDEATLMAKNRRPLAGLLKNGYDSIRWTGNTLRAKTDPVIIEFKGKKFKLGGFEITISTDGDIRISNKKNKIDGYDHPHVNGGIPCWGTMGTSISKLVAQLEFVPVLDMVLQYLKVYNQKSSFAKLGKWHNGSTCDECGEAKECCVC